MCFNHVVTGLQVYINWLYLIFLYLIPFFLLAVFNTLIYKEIRKANTIRASLSRFVRENV